MAEWSVNEDLKVMAEASDTRAQEATQAGNIKAAANFKADAKDCRTEVLKRQAQGRN